MTHITPTDGMVITADTTFAPGVYHLPNGLTIGADNVTVRGDNTLIVSPVQQGAGIRVDGQQNVTIRDLRLTGFYWGIRADAATNLTVENVTVRGTQEIEGIDTFLYLWLPIEQAYGGAVLFHGCTGGAIRGCDLQHQMNGVLLYGSTGVTVEKVNASFNSGWGVYMSASNECVLQDNQLDFCNRVYRRPENGSIRVEADAAGIVMVKGSSHNKILRNSCLCGGDGIFIAGYEHPGVIEPCSFNLFEENDCRLSPNNAIESTFSQGNIFRRNDCSRSNYGFWMGYSWDNTLEDNIVEFNRWVGIAAEHARDFVIKGNQVRLNGEGIRLWTRGGEVTPFFPDRTVAHHITIEDNLIETNNIGVYVYTGDTVPDDACNNITLSGNRIIDNRTGVKFGRSYECAITGNTFSKNVQAAVALQPEAGVELAGNQFDANAADQVTV